VGQLQLTTFVHTRPEHALLARPGRDVDFVRGTISSNQVGMHRPSYINAVLIQSREQVAPVACTQCARPNGLRPFPKCRFVPEHFGGACANCKWRDHATRCNLLEAEDDGSEDEWDEDRRSRSLGREDDRTERRRLRGLKLGERRLLRARNAFNPIVLD